MKKAKKGTRLSNLLLDGFIFTALFVGLVLLAAKIGYPFNVEGNDWGTVIYLLCQFAYYYGFELAFSRTPAKIITTTKVVHRDGSKPASRQILFRTLSRYIPFELLSFIFAESGWHDQFSKTEVVDC